MEMHGKKIFVKSNIPSYILIFINMATNHTQLVYFAPGRLTSKAFFILENLTLLIETQVSPVNGTLCTYLVL